MSICKNCGGSVLYSSSHRCVMRPAARARKAVLAGQIASGRACAICGSRKGALTGMRHALMNLGYMDGGYAHHRCYDKARNASKLSER